MRTFFTAMLLCVLVNSYPSEAYAHSALTLVKNPCRIGKLFKMLTGLSSSTPITVPPVIVTQPSSIVSVEGRSVFFFVITAGSEPLNFQWLKNRTPIREANQPTYSLNDIVVADSGIYEVVVSNPYGSITSNLVRLIVETILTITQSPSNQVAKAGSDVAFNVIASSKLPINYVWLKDGVSIPGANTNGLFLKNVQESDGGEYVVVLYTQEGGTRSKPALLTISGAIAPQIKVQPTNQTILVGGLADFSVQATGGLPLSFQWFKNGVMISNAITSGLSFDTVRESDAGSYSVVVTNRGGAITSTAASLFVNVPPVIKSQPTDRIVFAGTNVTFNVEASGKPVPTFRWLKNGDLIAGAVNASLSLVNVQRSDDAGYSVVVTNTVGAATSAVARLTVRLPAVIKTQPVSQTAFLGQTSSFFVDVDGEPPLALQWFKASKAIQNATNTTLIVTNAQLSDAGKYQLVVSNTLARAPSVEVNLSVTPSLYIAAQPASQTVLLSSNVIFLVVASGQGNLDYQWFKNGIPFGAINPSLAINGVQYSDEGEYLVRVSDRYMAATSSVARLTVNGPPLIQTQPQSQNVLSGTDARFVPEVRGSLPLIYQWLKNGAKYLNGTNMILELANVQMTDDAEYKFFVTNTYGTATSVVARLTIRAPPFITVQPVSQTNLIGSKMSFVVGVEGSPPIEYQWLKDNNPLPNQTNITLIFKSLTVMDEGSYRVVVSNPLGRAESSSAPLRVGTPASILFQPISQEVSVGASIAFAVGADGTPPLYFQWFKDGIGIQGATNYFVNLNGVKAVDNGTYAVSISNQFGRARSVDATLVIRAPFPAKGDFDGNGFPDIVFQDGAGQLASWYMVNSDLISAGFLEPSSVDELNWKIAGSGDFDQDGREDLIFQHRDGALVFWLMNGRRLKSMASLATGASESLQWRVVGTGDFDRDGKIDLLVRSDSGRLGIWFISSFTVISSSLLNLGNPIDPSWSVVGCGDFNEDGNLDVVFQHMDGTLAVWYLRSTTTISTGLFNPANPGDAQWRAVGVADRNRDGMPDLLFQHNVDGTLAVWIMNDTRLKEPRLLNPANPGGSWRVVAP